MDPLFLTQQILEAIEKIGRQETNSPFADGSNLVLLFTDSPPPGEWPPLFDRLAQIKFPLIPIFSPRAFSAIARPYLKSLEGGPIHRQFLLPDLPGEELLRGCKALLFPTMTHRDLAEWALGLNSPASHLLLTELARLHRSLPILAIEPPAPAHLPLALSDLHRGYRKHLADRGFSWCPLESLPARLEPLLFQPRSAPKLTTAASQKRVLTRVDLETLSERGGKRRVAVPRDTLLTALAEDYARDQGIELLWVDI